MRRRRASDASNNSSSGATKQESAPLIMSSLLLSSPNRKKKESVTAITCTATLDTNNHNNESNTPVVTNRRRFRQDNNDDQVDIVLDTPTNNDNHNNDIDLMRSMNLMMNNGDHHALSPLTNTNTEECSSHQSKDKNKQSESGWHSSIQKKDWATLQRHLEQVTSPVPPPPPSTEYTIATKDNTSAQHRHSHLSTNNNIDTTKKSTNAALLANATTTSNRDSYHSTGSDHNNNKTKRKSKLNWLFKRTVLGSGGTSQLSMGDSSRNNNTNNSYNCNGNTSATTTGGDHQHQQDSHHPPLHPNSNHSHNSSTTEFPLVSLDKESLLTTNADGRTPLHLALNNAPETPDHIIRDLVRAQPQAVFMTDTRGRLPLHFAVVRRQPLPTIQTLVREYPQSIFHKDQKGKTPIFYAMEVAKRHVNLKTAPKTYWATTKIISLDQDNEEHEDENEDYSVGDKIIQAQNRQAQQWQKQQFELWETALWLLQKTTSPDLQQQKTDQKQQPKEIVWNGANTTNNDDYDRNNRNQQSFLLEAMLHAAPPQVVAHLISTSSSLLKSTPAPTLDGSNHHQQRQQPDQQGISLGCSAFYLAVFRQYPIAILKQLGSLLSGNKQVQTVRDETGLGLVSAHYVTSCFEKSKLLEYVAAEDFMVTMEQCIVEGQIPQDDLTFLDWWEKLKFLIFFCAGKDPEETPDDYLLHASLENTDTPPNVIRLLLALYPGSARQPDAQSAHPLHLFAMHRDYIPRNYESPYMHGLNVMDMLLSLDESAVFHNFQQRLPLHHAIAAGRTWNTIHPLVSSYRSSLRIRDPISKLYPCQMAAAYFDQDPEDEATRLLQLTRNQYSFIVWQGLSQKQQQNAVERIRQFESLKRLDTVFELFRRFPQCVECALGNSHNRKISSSIHSNNGNSVLNKEIEVIPDRNSKQRATKGCEESAGPEMIAFHYLSWCYKKVNNKWHVVKKNMNILRTSIDVATEHGVLSRKSADFVNWWGMLKLYFWHCYNAMNNVQKAGPNIPRDDSFLLHVAVSISTTPPDIIKLILGLFPESASLPLPGSSTLPLHLACKSTTYTPQYFEVSTRPTTIELLVRAHPEGAFVRSDDGQVPLHIAIMAGKTMNELRPIIQQGPSLVSAKDSLLGLYPYQLMAMSKTPSSDMRLRFQTIASNRHAETWSIFSSQRKAKEIGIVENEYRMTVFTSSYELLRLKPCVMAETLGMEHGVDDEGLSISEEIETDLLELADSDKEERPVKKKVAPLRRLLSGLSADGSSLGGGAGSAFSTIDMMSTISNVSSPLSFRRNRSGVSNDKVSTSLLVDDVGDDESEDSDIWSEDVSFHDEVEKKSDRQRTDTFRRTGTPTNQISIRKQKLKSKWQGPINYATNNSAHSISRSVPKEIVETVESADDVSLLDGITARSRSGRATSELRKSLLDESTNSEEEFQVSDENPRAGDFTLETPTNNGEFCLEAPTNDAELKMPSVGQMEITRPDGLEDDRNETFIADNNRRAVPVEASYNIVEQAVQSAMDERNVVEDSDHVKGDASVQDDASIQDEIVHLEEQEDEEPIVFRLRRRTGRGPVRMKPGRRTLGCSQQNGSSMDMDFLSILNASLPEGKMDFLSTLEVSSGSLLPGPGSLPTGLDIKNMKVAPRMARIKEFPTELEHGASVVQQYSSELAKMDTSITRNVVFEDSVATGRDESVFHMSQTRQQGFDVPSQTESVPSNRQARGLASISINGGGTPLGSRHDSKSSFAAAMSSPHNSRSSSMAQSTSASRSGRRSLSLEITPLTSNYIGVKPNKLKSCLQCGKHNREVLMLPCSHLCVCRVCSEGVEIKSCPICFGPVTDQKVVS